MLMKEVLGQDPLKRNFLQSHAENRVAHAILLAGPAGYGGLPLAIAFARYLACTDKRVDDACGECPSCSKYNGLVHPDLHFVFPVNNGTKNIKDPVSDDFIHEWRECVLGNPYLTTNQWYSHIGIENKQGFISVKESGSIIRKLALKTYESDYKLIIIWLPEKMLIAASNKLLKTLEEPFSRTVFFLVTEHPEKLLPTIISRTQVLRLQPLAVSLIQQAVQQEFSLADEDARQIARISRGDYHVARSLATAREEAPVNFELFKRFMRGSYGYRVQEISTWVEEMAAAGREKQKEFLSYALGMIRENMLLSLVPGKTEELNCLTAEEAEFCSRFSKFIHAGNVHKVSDELTAAYRDIEDNGNSRIVLMDLCLKVSGLIRT